MARLLLAVLEPSFQSHANRKLAVCAQWGKNKGLSVCVLLKRKRGGGQKSSLLGSTINMILANDKKEVAPVFNFCSLLISLFPVKSPARSPNAKLPCHTKHETPAKRKRGPKTTNSISTLWRPLEPLPVGRCSLGARGRRSKSIGELVVIPISSIGGAHSFQWAKCRGGARAAVGRPRAGAALRAARTCLKEKNETTRSSGRPAVVVGLRVDARGDNLNETHIEE